MVRLIALAVGLVFCAALLIGVLTPREAVVPDPVKKLHLEPKHVSFAQDGPMGLGVFGTFDRAQLQRGYQVYKEVCAGCHSLSRVAFRDLAAIGFSEAEVKALAKQSEVASIDPSTGDAATRPAIPADKMPGPYANETAARAANNNALPPDLSLITKARHHGTAYVYSLLSGYRDAPAGWAVPEGLYYNPYFRSLNIAMIAPLSDGQVEYADGTKSTIDQNSKDVAAFLTWTAEPKMEERRRTGVAVIGFLIILTILSYLTYQRVWSGLKRKNPAAVPAE